MTTVEFERGSFDAAVALYSIGHLPRDEHEGVFGRLARWLRPGGLLLASLPADEDTGSIGPWLNGVEMFFSSLGSERYAQILRDDGWQIVVARVDTAHEPDGDVRFLWLLATAAA
jgi:SAM-dependent methyltransferase